MDSRAHLQRQSKPCVRREAHVCIYSASADRSGTTYMVHEESHETADVTSHDFGQ